MADLKTAGISGVVGIVGSAIVTVSLMLPSGETIEIPKEIDPVMVCSDKIAEPYDRIIKKVDPKDTTGKTIYYDTIHEPERIVVKNDGEAAATIKPGQRFRMVFVVDDKAMGVIPFEPGIELPDGQAWLIQARLNYTLVNVEK